jgi:DNA-binding NtrC family response regulator
MVPVPNIPDLEDSCDQDLFSNWLKCPLPLYPFNPYFHQGIDFRRVFDPMTCTNESNVMNKIRVLLVDDNSTVREAISMIINLEEDLLVCGEARNAEEAIEQFLRTSPDTVLLDLSLKESDGISLIRQFHESDANANIIIFSLHDEALYINAARDAGAQGYVCKSESPHDIINCIRTVSEGQHRFPEI